MTLTEKLSIQQIHLLRPIVAALRTRKTELADQLERAATGVALNIAEAGGHAGRDRVRVLRIAAGEAREVSAALAVAAAWGYANDDDLAAARSLADRLNGVLHGLIAKLE